MLATTLAVTIPLGVSTASGQPARAHGAQQCADSQFSSTRDPSNPLALVGAPGSNPLTGAHFFVDGPAHGAAAGAIATLLGANPKSYPDSYSWASFKQSVVDPALRSGKVSASTAHQVQLLEKIAGEPEPQRFSMDSAGGGPGKVLQQVQKIFCGNLRADPGAVPIFSTFFLYQAGYCETRGQILAHRANFERQVNELAQGIGAHPAVALLELDSIATASCTKGPGSLAAWEQNIRYEINAVSALPHTVVYTEGGYSDANSPRFTASVLNAVGVGRIRGFFTNDTHQNWTIDEIRWAEKVSRMTHGAHFIVNTANNGQGPLRPRNQVKYGREILCNPPGRGLGPRDTTHTGFPHADAFLWTTIPGNSGGTCHGGPPAGQFFLANALGKATRANSRLGPGFPSRPF